VSPARRAGARRPTGGGPTRVELRRVVAAALEEDLGRGGDLTSRAVVAERARGEGRFLLKQPGGGVVAGLPVVAEVFRQVDRRVAVRALVREGRSVPTGTVLAIARGPVRSLFSGERVALNFLQHLCGVATLTRSLVDRVRGTAAAILDTRKTVPGLRALEKYAVRMGGGVNHRSALDRQILIKTNHLRAAARDGGDLDRVLAAARRLSPRGQLVQIEVRDRDELRRAVEAGARLVMLDNFTPADVRRAVRWLRERPGPRVTTEVSGGVSLRNVAAYARAGVDRISVGAITHSAPALDVSMVFRPAVARRGR